MCTILLAAVGVALLPVRSGLAEARGGAGSGAARTLSDLDGQVITHDFDDGDLGPFYPCTVRSPNFAAVEGGRVKTYWTETSYDGSRMTKGAEFCDAERGVDRDLEYRTFKEGWMGFKLNIEPGHSTTSSSALAQVFQFDDSRDVFTWAGLLELDQGDLRVVHRACMCESGTMRGLVFENVPFGVDLNIVIGFIASTTEASQGMFKVWVDGDLKYSAEGINFGFGQWEDDDTMNHDNTYITLKLGMYNHEDSSYVSGEERTVWYDDVAWYNGSEGYSVVDPSGASAPTPQVESVPEDVSGEAAKPAADKPAKERGPLARWMDYIHNQS